MGRKYTRTALLRVFDDYGFVPVCRHYWVSGGGPTGCHKVCSPLLLCCGEEAGRKLVESTDDGVGRMYLNLVASVCHGR